jgi:hypothetical protein
VFYELLGYQAELPLFCLGIFDAIACRRQAKTVQIF